MEYKGSINKVAEENSEDEIKFLESEEENEYKSSKEEENEYKSSKEEESEDEVIFLESEEENEDSGHVSEVEDLETIDVFRRLNISYLHLLPDDTDKY